MNKTIEQLRRFAIASLVVTVAGCASGAGQTHHAQIRDTASAGLSSGAPMPLIASTWWDAFGDPQLTRLIQTALDNNPNLKVARARIERAQALAGVTDSAGMPQLNASIELTRQRYTETGMIPPPLAGAIRNTGTAQLAGVWELDFFGKHQAALNAALGAAKASQADEQAARVLLASQVARTYFQWARLQGQMDVAQRTLEQKRHLAQLVRERFDAGLDSPLELQQSEGSLPEARQKIEALREQAEWTRNALAALVGQPLAQLPIHAPAFSTLKSLPLESRLPADLLAHRADIAAARWRIEAGLSEVDQARAKFYPNINLMAFTGFSSIGLNHLLQSASEQWGVGPAVHLPLFDGGYLRANLRAKNAELDQAIETYNATVLESIRDAADQATSLQSLARQQTEQRSAMEAAESTYHIAMQRYEKGLVNQLQVLNAETGVLTQRRLAVDLQARQFDAQVGLIRALGGGYASDVSARF